MLFFLRHHNTAVDSSHRNVFHIHYYTVTKKERYFTEEVTRVTWAKQQEEKTGIPQNIRPAFSARPAF